MADTLTLDALDQLLASFDWDTWNEGFAELLSPAFLRIAVIQGRAVAADLGGHFDIDDPFTQRHFTTYLAARVTQIDETTREVLRDELAGVIADSNGLSLTALAARIADAVKDAVVFAPSRALTIARTETATAYNLGALASFRQNDIDEVEVSDGDGDEECAEADGQVWTIEEALANPLAHPNCVRSFGPVQKDA